MTDPTHTPRKRIFSFEFFPPKTDEGVVNLLRTVEDLRDAHAPDYVSVTYGAGGSTRTRTLEVVSRIQNELGIRAMAHQTCVAASRDEIREHVGVLRDRGITHVLALRGDPPKDRAEFVAPKDGFRYGSDLVAFLRETFPDMTIGAACYPEVHPESRTADDDLRFAKLKVENGAKFLITQLFFDNDCYFRFVDRARAAGIDVPIVPGIMPITNYAQIQRFTKMCGATIPKDLCARLERFADDPAIVMANGIEQAVRQCRDLLAGGAPGVHFYTLNKSHATRSVLAAL